MADIPLPNNGYGIYEKLGDFKTGEDLSDQLQQRCRKYFGTPAREFIGKLVRERKANKAALKKFLKAERAAYRKALAREVKAESLKKPLGRSSGRYATVFAAGRLASKYEIVPWSRKRILKAILSCQLDQLRQADDDGGAATSPENLRGKLVQYLNDHHAEFMYLNKKRPQLGSDRIDAVPGYREKRKGQRWCYLTADRLKAIIGRGTAANTLKTQLVAEGLMDRSPGRWVVQRTIFAGGKGNDNCAWVHAFKFDITKT
jgi:putative DNA primase/helicase